VAAITLFQRQERVERCVGKVGPHAVVRESGPATAEPLRARAEAEVEWRGEGEGEGGKLRLWVATAPACDG
jgi:hypothetical protein